MILNFAASWAPSNKTCQLIFSRKKKRKLKEFLLEKSVEVNTRGHEGEGPALADGDLFVPAVPQRPHHCNQVMTVPRLQ